MVGCRIGKEEPGGFFDTLRREYPELRLSLRGQRQQVWESVGTLYLCAGLRFDFREDLDAMESLKAWPVRPWRVFLATLLPEVVLVSGPVNLATPVGVTRIDVETASAMHQAVQEAVAGAASPAETGGCSGSAASTGRRPPRGLAWLGSGGEPDLPRTAGCRARGGARCGAVRFGAAAKHDLVVGRGRTYTGKFESGGERRSRSLEALRPSRPDRNGRREQGPCRRAAGCDGQSGRFEMTRYRLSQARIEAPFEGVVVEGDLRERVGSPVKQGEVLLKVARLDPMYVEGKVHERNIHLLERYAFQHGCRFCYTCRS